MKYMVSIPGVLDMVCSFIHLFSDAARRQQDSNNPHVKMCLKDFIAGVNDPESIQCILAAVSPRLKVPELIS